ncbi:MAG: Zn-ribbon domain-containing OB-fold protein [Gammaproteobacteria bacterium]
MGTPLRLPQDLSALPVPDVAGEWKPFWDAAAQGRLLLQECRACGHRQFYPRALCTKCGSEPGWLAASGQGTLYTYSVVRQNLVRPFKDMLPYALAMVDLAEGVRMMTNVVDCDLEDLHVGMPLELFFASAGTGLHIPYWRPRRKSSAA